MCVIERFNLVHPNGAPERKERLQYCPFGSPTAPCNNARIDYLPDAFVPWPQPTLGEPHQVEENNPRAAPRPSRQEETRRFKKFSNDLKLVFDFHIPFTSRKTKKKNRPGSERVFVRRRESQNFQDTQPPMRPQPLAQPTGYGRPIQGEPAIVHVPDGPQRHALHNAEPRIIQPMRRHPLDVQIHNGGDSSSPSPPTPFREHRRHHSRTPSEVQRYEELKRQIRERERRDHIERRRREQAERDARDADEARRQAERETERLRRQNIELMREERRRLHREERQNALEQERRREEQHRIQYQEQRRLESTRQERRRQEMEEYEREQARLQQELEDRQIMQEAAVRERLHNDRIRRDQNERDRLDRQRRAGIPLRPRHETELHHRPHVSFEDRGTQVIDDAIRAENRRRYEGRAPAPPTRGWSRRRDVGGGLQRRDTIAVTQRQVYEDDRRRGGRRFI
ncbi:hypothetical protein G7Y79_00035g070770 [Physcia stellaris]|nr:hypothetical protein G7Y79_00035g070770 [Physcia stellaris]